MEKNVLVTVDFETGPAAQFVQAACKYKSGIQVKRGGKTVNGKSFMGLISIGIAQGEEIAIIADGDDESDAVNELARLIGR
jgi:phosphocarrier protein